MVERARALVVAHGHPEHSPGGGEIAARALHRLLDADERFDSVFLARHDDPFPVHAGSAFSGTGDAKEILFHASLGDRFLFEQADPARVWRHFRDMLQVVRPDIVHFHHFLHLGLEMLGEVTRLRPRVPIAMTLHDFQAICHNEGQMVRTGSGELCHRARPGDCNRCFPSRSAQEFALRERYVKSWLDRVDRFVAPSEFLAERYVDWGIERSRVTVLENLLDPDTDRAAHAASAATGDAPRANARLRLAFFGRINGVKGVDLLLEALEAVSPEVRAKLRLDVHGAGLERQPLARRRALRRAARRLGDAVRFRGAYRPADIPSLMAENDWMVMPSRWWENSPVVILEARRHALPVLCADIGGMAEKIEHGVTGLHFRANDARALAERLSDIVALGEGRRRFADAIAATSEQGAIAARHLALHLELLGGDDTITADPDRTPDLRA